MDQANWFVHEIDVPDDPVNKDGFALSVHVYKSCTDEFEFVDERMVELDTAPGSRSSFRKSNPINDLFYNIDLDRSDVRNHEALDFNQLVMQEVLLPLTWNPDPPHERLATKRELEALIEVTGGQDSMEDTAAIEKTTLHDDTSGNVWKLQGPGKGCGTSFIRVLPGSNLRLSFRYSLRDGGARVKCQFYGDDLEKVESPGQFDITKQSDSIDVSVWKNWEQNIRVPENAAILVIRLFLPQANPTNAFFYFYDLQLVDPSTLPPEDSSPPEKRPRNDALTVIVSNIPWKWTEEQVKTDLRHLGNIAKFSMVRDAEEGIGIAYITYSNRKEVDKALDWHGKEIYGHKLKIMETQGHK